MEKINLLLIFIILIILIVIILVIYKQKLNKIENFISDQSLKKNKEDTIIKAVNCINLDENIKIKFDKFVNNFKTILLKYKLSDIFVIENSVKFNEQSINLNRNAIFIEYVYLNNNKNLLNDILDITDDNKIIKEKLKKEISDTLQYEGQLVIGVDFKNNSKRIYLNYKNNIGKFIIKGLQWQNNNVIFIKEYEHIENHQLVLKKIGKMFDLNIVNKFLEIFPVESWDDICFKNDNSLKESDINSIQFAFKFSPKVNILNEKLIKFIKLFYNKDDLILDKWMKCFKDTVITYIQLGKRDNKNELTIYTASFNNNFLDEVNSQLFNLLNNKDLVNYKELLN